MSLLGSPKEEEVVRAWEASMKDVLNVQSQDDIPELNKYQCGTYTMHSLEDAKAIAKGILDKGIGVMSNEELKLDLSKI